MGNRRCRRALGATALLAILFTSIGSHIVHPAFHEHLHATASANDGHLHRRAGAQDVHARARPLSSGGSCPICLLLAAFHADCGLAVGLVPCIDQIPERRCPPALPAAQKPCRGAVETTILFDTGGDGGILLANMRACGIEAAEIDAVVLSHNHFDHTGGLGAFLEANSHVTVYLPKVFPEAFKQHVRKAGATVVKTDAPRKVCTGAWTTGVLGRGIPEQGLYLKGRRGLVVMTGCAHPGIVRIVEAATAHAGVKPDTVMGGFHLAGASQRDVRSVIDALKQLGVVHMAPCHCSGDETRRWMKEAFGNDYLPAGTGADLTFQAQTDS